MIQPPSTNAIYYRNNDAAMGVALYLTNSVAALNGSQEASCKTDATKSHTRDKNLLDLKWKKN